jgi:hypothetical protein
MSWLDLLLPGVDLLDMSGVITRPASAPCCVENYKHLRPPPFCSFLRLPNWDEAVECIRNALLGSVVSSWFMVVSGVRH